MNIKMKTLILTMVVYFLCTATNSPQPIRDSISMSHTETVLITAIPDTTIYDIPIKPDLDKQLLKMSNAAKESKKTLQQSIEIQKAIDKEKEQKQIKEAVDFLKKRGFKQVQ